MSDAKTGSKINFGQLPTIKREKGLTRISVHSLAEFKDLEEDEPKPIGTRRQPCEKPSGLLGILPPLRGSISPTKTNSMIPHVLTQKPVETTKKTLIPNSVKKVQKPLLQINPSIPSLKSLSSIYASDSEDEDDDDTASSNQTDFFSLSSSTKIPDELLVPMSNSEIEALTSSDKPHTSTVNVDGENLEKGEDQSNKTLVSNIMNLSKEEILLKNKAEVGPKLPVPEQEYHIDSEGNVAFDEKAIEYLCGKRGVKRKNEFNNVNVVEISGEDIKPDERDWLVKALTEEPVQRPVSVNAGPSGISKKKHQITYLAHQAKAMELELKNQWAANKATRQQTRSKYGF